jgi:hypothetical protein
MWWRASSRPLDEAGDGCCLLVSVELDEGEPGVVVDDRVRVVVADPCVWTHPVRERRERSPVTRWPGRRKRA